MTKEELFNILNDEERKATPIYFKDHKDDLLDWVPTRVYIGKLLSLRIDSGGVISCVIEHKTENNNIILYEFSDYIHNKEVIKPRILGLTTENAIQNYYKARIEDMHQLIEYQMEQELKYQRDKELRY